MELKKGTLLCHGKYQISRTLGTGGFGITYLATTKGTTEGAIGTIEVKVPIAIKEFFVKENCYRATDGVTVMMPQTEAGKRVMRYREKFVKEAQNIAAMSHPNIVHVSDVFEENNTVYYAMQYLRGGSLRDAIKKSGIPMEEQRALKYIRQIASALDYMHSQKMCHLDVKPSNIMLDDEDNAVLIDFGIAKRYDEQGRESTTTPTGVSAGFAPLEQYQGLVHDFAPYIDIYSLGATLLCLLTASVPPDANTLLEKRGLGPRPANISPNTWRAISMAMQPIRKQRLQSMKAFIDTLDGQDDEVTIVEDDFTPSFGEETVIVGQGRPTNREETVIIGNDDHANQGSGHQGNGIKQNDEPRRSSIVPFAAGLIVALVICLGGYWLWNRSDETKEQQVTDYRLADGTMYTGTLKGGKPEGRGKAVYADGRIYEGCYADGLRNDTAAHFVDKKGYVFDGVFAVDTIQRGRLVLPQEGYYFVGDFSNNQPYNGWWYYSADNTKGIQVINGKEVEP